MSCCVLTLCLLPRLTFRRRAWGLRDQIAAFILGAFDKLRRPQKVNELITKR